MVLDKYTIIEVHRIRTIFNWLQHFDMESLGKELEESGFAVETFYGDVVGGEYLPGADEFAVVAKKR